MRRLVGFASAMGVLLLLGFFLPANLGAQEPGEPYGYVGRYVSRGEPTAAPTALGERALIPSADRRLYLLAPGGEIAWRAELGGKAVAPATPAAEGTLAVFTDQGEVSLLDGEDGRLIWRRRIRGLGRPMGDGVAPTLLTSREGMILLALANRLTSLSLSGAILWERELRSPLSTPPVWGPNGTLLAATVEGRLTAYSGDGALRWTTLLDEAATDLDSTEQRVLVLQEGGRVRSFDPEGEEMTAPPLSAQGREGSADALSGTPERIGVAPEGALLVFYREGGLLMANRAGELLWSAPGAVDFALTPEGVLIALPRGRGELRSYRGRLLWELQSEGEIHDLLTLRGYFLILFGDWVVSWYRSGNSGAGPGAEQPVATNRGESTDPDLPILFSELFRSPNPRDRERLLRAIEERTERGELAGIYRGVRELTMDIALEPYRKERRQGAGVQNDYPALRARGATLLGQWGDIPSWRALLALLREEREPGVVLAALQALSGIPYDRHGEAAVTLRALLGRWSGNDRFPAIAEGILDVLAAVRTAPGPSAREAFAQIATADLPPTTTARARRLMASHFENRR